eukprot:XP_015581480.1 GDSL esterase/lipase 7 [Ricinus communis]
MFSKTYRMARNYSSLLFLCLLCFFLVRSRANNVPALFIFGDSLLDAGNNNWLSTKAKANYFPYGIDHPLGATGRFTNGRTIADFFAEWLGLKFQRPYMQVATLHIEDIYDGLNYASGSAGIFCETAREHVGINLSMGKQVSLFNKTVKNFLPLRYKSETELANYLSKSIFVVYIGNNDFLFNFEDFLKPNITIRPTNPDEFSSLLVKKLGDYLKELYQLGARKFVVFELPPLGCFPGIAKELRARNECDEKLNSYLKIFNAKYAKVVDDLRSLQGSTFVFAKTFNLTYDIVQNPTHYGIADSELCVSKDWKACENRKAHVFFDPVHPTEITYNIIASQCFNGTSLCYPMNVKELADTI